MLTVLRGRRGFGFLQVMPSSSIMNEFVIAILSRNPNDFFPAGPKILISGTWTQVENHDIQLKF